MASTNFDKIFGVWANYYKFFCLGRDYSDMNSDISYNFSNIIYLTMKVIHSVRIIMSFELEHLDTIIMFVAYYTFLILKDFHLNHNVLFIKKNWEFFLLI